MLFRSLFGRGTLECALVEMWNRRVEFHLFLPVSSVFQHLHPFMKALVDPQVPEWGEANKPCIAGFLSSSTVSFRSGPMWRARTTVLPTSPRWSRSIS